MFKKISFLLFAFCLGNGFCFSQLNLGNVIQCNFLTIDSIAGITDTSCIVYMNFKLKNANDTLVYLKVKEKSNEFLYLYVWGNMYYCPDGTMNCNSRYMSTIDLPQTDTNRTEAFRFFIDSAINEIGNNLKIEYKVANLTPKYLYDLESNSFIVFANVDTSNHKTSGPGTADFRDRLGKNSIFSTLISKSDFRTQIKKYWVQKTNQPVLLSRSMLTIGAQTSTSLNFPADTTIFPYHIGKKRVYISKSSNIISEISSKDYFKTHYKGIDYFDYSGKDTSVTIPELDPGTTFYITSGITFNSSPGWPFPGNDLIFFGSIQQCVLPQPISENNSIVNGNVDLCPSFAKQGAYVYDVPELVGTQVTGGNGHYQYLWQCSIDTQKWDSLPLGQGQQYGINYDWPQTSHNEIPPVTYVRRIVVSATETDTSDMIMVKFLPDFQQVVIRQVSPGMQNGIQLKTDLFTPVFNYLVEWTDSTSKASQRIKIASLPGGDLFVPANSSTDHFYQATINFPNGCPSKKSVIIGISEKDGDGNIYPTVDVGATTWMMTNLFTTSTNSKTSLAPGSYWNYNSNNPKTDAIPWGLLYSQNVVSNDNVCPIGWHIATSLEWSGLIEYAGKKNPAAILKSPFDWIEPDIGYDNYNFSALPAGELNKNGFENQYISAYWWSTNVNGPGIIYKMINNDDGVYYFTSEQYGSYSIRCVKNRK